MDSVPKGEHEALKVSAPTNANEAMERVKAAVAEARKAEGVGSIDRAALMVEAEVGVAAEYFLEVESEKIGKAVNRARFRGAVQNLKMLGKEMHSLAHQEVEKLTIDMMGARVSAELDKLARLMGSE